MEQQQISAKKQKAMEKVKRANAELAKVVREEKEQLRKAQDRHKYMMGGCVVKYFPEAYDFSEQEMNRMHKAQKEGKRAPKSAAESIPFEAMDEDGLMVLGNKQYSIMLEFADTYWQNE